MAKGKTHHGEQVWLVQFSRLVTSSFETSLWFADRQKAEVHRVINITGQHQVGTQGSKGLADSKDS